MRQCSPCLKPPFWAEVQTTNSLTHPESLSESPRPPWVETGVPKNISCPTLSTKNKVISTLSLLWQAVGFQAGFVPAEINSQCQSESLWGVWPYPRSLTVHSAVRRAWWVPGWHRGQKEKLWCPEYFKDQVAVFRYKNDNIGQNKRPHYF